jgi:hypothetical protein
MIAYIRNGNTYLIKPEIWRGLRSTIAKTWTDEVLRANSEFAMRGEVEFLKFGGDQLIRSKVKGAGA